MWKFPELRWRSPRNCFSEPDNFEVTRRQENTENEQKM